MQLDGQYLASRLSRSITKESSKLKELIKEYNKLVPERQLDWANVVSLSLDEELTIDRHLETEQTVPRTVRIECIKNHYLSLRAQEELNLLKQEMENVIQYFSNDRQTILEHMAITATAGDAGAHCLLKMELRRIEDKLQKLCLAYQPYIDTPELPFVCDTTCMGNEEQYDNEEELHGETSDYDNNGEDIDEEEIEEELSESDDDTILLPENVGMNYAGKVSFFASG